MSATTATYNDIWTTHPTSNGPDMSLVACDGARVVTRLAQQWFGVALSMSALSLWFLPVATGSTSEVLCKLIVSLVLGFAGIALWQAGAAQPKPQLELDVVRREVRLVRHIGEEKGLLKRRRFSELEEVQIQGNTVALWADNGTLLAELTLSDDVAMRSFRSALRDEGFEI